MTTNIHLTIDFIGSFVYCVFEMNVRVHIDTYGLELQNAYFIWRLKALGEGVEPPYGIHYRLHEVNSFAAYY